MSDKSRTGSYPDLGRKQDSNARVNKDRQEESSRSPKPPEPKALCGVQKTDGELCSNPVTTSVGSCGIKKHIKQRRGKKSTLDEPASRGEEVGLLQDNESSNESDPELAVELRKEAGHAETSIVSAVPKAGGMGEDVQNQGQSKCKAITGGSGPCPNDARAGYQTYNIKSHCEQDPSVFQNLPLRPADPPQQAPSPSPHSTRNAPGIFVTPPPQARISSPTPALAPFRPVTTPTLTPTMALTTSPKNQVSASPPKSDRSPETSVASIRQEMLQQLDRSTKLSVAAIRQEVRDGDEKLGSELANAAQTMRSLQEVVHQLPVQMELLFAKKQVTDAMYGQIDELQQGMTELRLELVENAAQQRRAIEDTKLANENALAQMRQHITPEVQETITKITSSSTHDIQSMLATQAKRSRDLAEKYTQNKLQVQGELQALDSKVQSLAESIRRSEAMNESLSQQVNEVNTTARKSKQHWADIRSGTPPQVSSLSSQYPPSFLQRDESSGSARTVAASQEKIKRQADVVERLRSQLLNSYGEDEEKLERDLQNLSD